MKRSVQMLVAMPLLAVAAFGVVTSSHAQPKPPVPPIPPVPIAPLATNVTQLSPQALAALPHGVFRGLAPLANGEKVTRVKAILGGSPTEADLGGPWRLNVRAPYVGPQAYLNVSGWSHYAPQYDPPELLLGPNPEGTLASSSAALVFQADASKAYLLDCQVRGGHGFRTQLTVTVPDSATAIVDDSATSTPPSDGHLTAVVRRDARVRQVTWRVASTASAMYLGTCEITSVR